MKKRMIVAALLVGLSVSSYGGRADMYIEECNSGTVEMCLMAAQFLENENKLAEAQKYYKKSMAILNKECSAGDWSACDTMGDFYRKGAGGKKNKEEAKKAYEKSLKLLNKNCKKGDQDSCGAIDFVSKKMKKV